MKFKGDGSFSILSVLFRFWLFRLHLSQNKFKLKPGAQGKLCLECHDDL